MRINEAAAVQGENARGCRRFSVTRLVIAARIDCDDGTISPLKGNLSSFLYVEPSGIHFPEEDEHGKPA
ncbi:hypothetical protein [Paenibacillus sp.]|uniref:hypothetical protein n=1 Tax=Paenibacillus sp. TaxID=58172 RepID=UPI002D778B85|nr:hypothetical protein [Paenibacillus sp.]